MLNFHTHIRRLGYISLFTSTLTLFACTDDDASSTQNNQTPSQMMNQGEGSEEKTSFEVESKDSGTGMSEKVENEIPNEQASKETSGAAIAGSILNIYLVAPNGTTISAVVETTEGIRAPGSFQVGAPPEGSFVTWLAPANGQILNSQSGQIKLTGCPKASGDKVVGSFENVELVSEFGGATQTLNGNFDVLLYSVAGELFCTETSEPKPMPNNDPMPGSCDVQECDAEGGSCCPYGQCIFSCEFRCVTQDPACSNPLMADVVKCAECFEACLDECNVSAECRSDYTSLAMCQQDAGCENEGDDMTCTRANCCTELDAAF